MRDERSRKQAQYSICSAYPPSAIVPLVGVAWEEVSHKKSVGKSVWLMSGRIVVILMDFSWIVDGTV